MDNLSVNSVLTTSSKATAISFSAAVTGFSATPSSSSRRSVLLDQVANNHSRAEALNSLTHASVDRYTIGQVLHHELQKFGKQINRTKAALTSAKRLDLKKKNLHVSSGGHIARQLLDPMDEHFKMLKPARYIYPLASLPASAAVTNPDWDHFFANADALHSLQDAHQDDLSVGSETSASTIFDQTMGSFRIGSPEYLRKAGTPHRDKSPSKRQNQKPVKVNNRKDAKFLHKTYLFLPKLADEVAALGNKVEFVDEVYVPDPTHTSSVISNRLHSVSSKLKNLNPQQFSSSDSIKSNVSSSFQSVSSKCHSVFDSNVSEEHKNLQGNMLLCWTGILSRFRKIVEYISLADLHELCKLRHPPPMLVPIIGYICLLIGVEPTWVTAKRTVLKEVGAFRRLLSTINPSNIALGHAINAVKYKNDFMAEWDEREAGFVSKAVARILR
jgi:hypothetical protein